MSVSVAAGCDGDVLIVIWYLQHVIRVLNGMHIHRVVVTDFSGVPTSVVSLRDVLSVLVAEPADYFGSA